MKYFEKYGKYNFVDDNNVLVGYDSSEECCEKLGFVLSNKPIISWYTKRVDDGYAETMFFSPKDYNYNVKNEKDINILKYYVFDTDFFNDENDELDSDLRYVQFKLKRLVGDVVDNEIFLTLYNHQNGYYSHGFNMDVGGTTIRTGEI